MSFERKFHKVRRHSIELAIPDKSISTHYPTDDNYIFDDISHRSPKSLVELCIDEICRSLPELAPGELPAGILDSYLVERILKSLVQHSALNFTTLKSLRRCELNQITLAGCRGVSDDWLSIFCKNRDEVQDTELNSSSSSSSFRSVSSTGQTDLINESICCCNPYSCRSLPLNMTRGDNSSFIDSNYESHSFVSLSQVTLLDLRGSQRLTDRGLSQLHGLTSLEIANLDNCYSLTGRGLSSFSNCYSLHTLSLSNCRCLTDEALVHISHLSSIRALSLDGCRCLTDISLENISNLNHLQKLELSQCDLISDNGLAHINGLNQIEELSLGWCRAITDQGLNILASQPLRAETLRALCLARCSITGDGIKYLGKLKALEELDINGCSGVNSSDFSETLLQLNRLTVLDVSYCPGILRTSWQGKINNLIKLDLCFSGVKKSHLSRLTDLPVLEELNLDSCPIGDWEISHLAENNVMPNLTSLNLSDTDLTDVGIVHLQKFRKITRLSLFYCNISDAGLQHLSQMTLLEVLNLDSREISDDGLFHLLELNHLKSLDVFSGRITDAGCSHIAQFKSLENLELCGGGITNCGCAYLASLENLKSLNLSQNEKITDRGAASLGALFNLKSLNLSNTKVTSDALKYLSSCRKLQSLALYGSNYNKDEVLLKSFQQKLPNLKCIRLNNSPDDEGKIIDKFIGKEDFDCDESMSDNNTESLNKINHDNTSDNNSSDSSFQNNQIDEEENINELDISNEDISASI